MPIETGDTMPEGVGDTLVCFECEAEMKVKPGQTVPACVNCGGTEFDAKGVAE